MAKASNKTLQKENSWWIRGEQIGKGSFGTVSVGFDRRNGRVFAVKSVPLSFAAPAQVEAIENEISILKSLSSPFVVEYHGDDSTAASDSIYRNLHIEYVTGGTAADLAESDDEELLRRYTWCIVSALKYVHSKGIIHCDVKGRNVVVDRGSGIAKLADFGSAKLVGGGDRRGRIVPRGSPLWMAPEVVRGESQGIESDVWALGCTVIEMVTGSAPWRDEGMKTLSRIGYSDELPRFPTRLSGEGADFVEKCLRRDPARRWSCDQLIQHPFLCFESTVKIGRSPSPRSVIERPRFEVSDDDEEEDGFAVNSEDSSAGDRIGKLAGLEGAIWESDGWVEVRCIVGSGGDEEAGTSSVFSEFWRVKEESNSSLPTTSGGGGLGGGCGDECGLAAAVEEGRKFSIEMIYFLLSILYYTNHLNYCCYKYVRNMPFFIWYIIFQLSSITLQVHSDFTVALFDIFYFVCSYSCLFFFNVASHIIINQF